MASSGTVSIEPVNGTDPTIGHTQARATTSRRLPSKKAKMKGMTMNSKTLIRILAVGVFLLLLAVAKPFVIVRAGTVGVVYSFGSIVGQVDEGFHVIWPWWFVTHTDIKVQRAVLDKLPSFSAETQDVFVKASLNYQVSPKAVQTLFRTVGPDYFHVLIEPRVAQNFKDETVKYKSVDIAPNREKIRQAVRQRLETELSPYSIHIIDLLLDNVVFSAAF